MTAKEGYISLINQILNETGKVVVFKNRIKSLELIFGGIINVIKEHDLPTKKKQLKSMSTKLSAFLAFLKKLTNKDDLNQIIKDKNYQSIETFLSEINERIDDIINSISKLYSEKFFIPKYELQQDLHDIQDLEKNLTDQQLLDEVETYHKFYNQSFIDKLDKFYKNHEYQLNPSKDYSKHKLIKEDETFEYYEGELTSSKERVQITVLKDRSKFETFIPILIKMNKPFVEKFIGIAFIDESIEIITQIKGVPLKDILKNKNISKTIITYKIAEAMSYLHSQMIVHRGLDLSDIYINNFESDDITEIEPIITDFWQSIIIYNSSFLGLPNASHKNSFIAPELTSNYTYNDKVDVFAFGGLIYEFCTGERPFEKEEIKHEIIDGIRPEIPEGLSDDFKVLIECCWSQKPEYRASFDCIIDFMRDNIIVFPDELGQKQQIESFYEKQKFKSQDFIECMDSFEKIFEISSHLFFFKYELFRAQTYLRDYKYKLKYSKYSSNDLSEKEIEQIKNLNKVMKTLKDIFTLSLKIDWVEKNSIDYVTSNLNIYMNEVYEVIKEMNFEIRKYEEDIEEACFDYYDFKKDIGQFYNLNDQKKTEIYCKIIKQIDVYIFNKDRYINDEEYIYSSLKVIFSPFKSKEVDQGQFYYKDDIFLGDGCESSVFKGVMILRDKENPTEFKFENVAIKVVNPNFLKHGLVYIRREIGYLTFLHNDSFLDFVGYSISEDEEQLWLITKYIEGKDLGDMVYFKRLNSYEKTKIAFQIAEGMKFLHNHRIIHRDLKSPNIMIADKDKSAKIIDFGYSTYDVNANSHTTQRGTFCYMAPEVISGRQYDKSIDVFSFAMILWEMYAGYIPYFYKDGVDPFGKHTKDDEESSANIMNKITNDIKPEFTKECPKALENLIKESWNSKAELRPTFDQIVDRMIDEKISYVNDSDNDSSAMKIKVDEFYAEQAAKRGH